MKVLTLFGLVLVSLMLVCGTTQAQYKDLLGFEVGVYGGVAQDNNGSDETEPGSKFRACLAYPLLDRLQVEIGYAFTDLKAKDYRADLFPLDLRLRFCPWHNERAIPYVYAGIGLLNYSHEVLPHGASTTDQHKGWTSVIPAGAGFQYKLTDLLSFDVHGGYNQTFSKDVNPLKADDAHDSYLTLSAGFRIGRGTGEKDSDGDGLSNAEEKRLGTNPKNPDTDGDGLSDGDEVRRHQTEPLREDTDGDGLKDGDEVRTHRTAPTRADTDGDGLKDGEEITQYRTDPLKSDTDGDALSDGEEVTKYKTDPLKMDTDGDTLGDGAEINTHKTDPLKADTDGGTVNDNFELDRGSNPNNPADDIPKVAITEVGKPIVLEGIVFKSGSAEILPESEKILEDAFATLRDNPQVYVEITGHTDSTGKRDKNLKLSADRANAVRDWLIRKGIDGARMTTQGFGPDRPVAPNATPEGRQKNRRIEFVRTK